MPTIYEIAKEAGVSSSTVARVLRGENKDVRSDSRERSARIREIAERLGYQQNWRAKAFSKGRTHAIGLLATSHSEWLFEGVMGEIAGTLTNELRDLGYHLVMISVDQEGSWKELVQGGRLDGLLVLHHFPEEARELLDSANMPMLEIGCGDIPGVPGVDPDDEGGAYLATRHLIELGHRRIAMYAEDVVRPHCSVRDRRRGFTMAMEESNLTDAPFWCVPEEDLLDLLVRSKDRPTAMLCYCHAEAINVYQTLWRHGLQVPHDLSVIAFNHLPLTQKMTPPLTTVGYDTARLARLGAQMMVELCEGTPLEKERVVLNPSIELRASTSPLMQPS